MDTNDTDGVRLVKGGYVNAVELVKKHGGTSLTKLAVTLSWPENTTDGPDHDPDVVAFVLGANGKVLNKDYALTGFLGEEDEPHVTPDGALLHTGDDMTGGTGETIEVDLTKLDDRAQRIMFSVTIYHASFREQNFGSLGTCTIRVDDTVTGKMLAEGDLAFDNSLFTAVNFVELVRRSGGWYIHTVGEGYKRGLGGLFTDFGIRVTENEYDDGEDEDE